VLQLLEDPRGESLIIATSNHPQHVDAAAWRRFDEVITFGMLDQAQVAELITLKLRAQPTDISTNTWAATLRELAPAEVERVCLDAIRRTVLSGARAVDDAAMARAAERMRVRRATAADAGTGGRTGDPS
jgi:SpoVK/Ycf46/Vps4 family AAA+-type ATPase